MLYGWMSYCVSNVKRTVRLTSTIPASAALTQVASPSAFARRMQWAPCGGGDPHSPTKTWLNLSPSPAAGLLGNQPLPRF